MVSASYPLVSVVVPYHNESDLIARAIHSIQGQTYPGPIEIIVVDDASDVPPPLSPEGPWPIQLISSTHNLYAGGARNLGIEHSRGELVCFLDADDTFFPDRIERHVCFFQAHPEVLLVGAPHRLHQGKSVEQTPPAIREFHPELVHQSGVIPERIRLELCMTYCFNTGAITARRSALKALGGFNAAYRWGEEWDLQVRIAQHGRIGYVAHPAYHYVCREGSICSTVNPLKQESRAAMFRNWRRTIVGLPHAHRSRLKQIEHEELLLAGQLYLEGAHRPRKALRCCLRALTRGMSIWGARSTVRCTLHTGLSLLGTGKFLS